LILTVTLNAALDVTYHVDALVVHATNRVRDVHQRAGGKGINVARVLHALGHDVVVTGLAGGGTGSDIRHDLAVAGLRDELVDVAAESRRTVTIVDDSDATVLNEPGPVVATAEWSAFVTRFAQLARTADVVVLAGSLPPGVPADGYAELGRAAGGRPVLLDTSGPALLAGLTARPAVVKPNRHELAEIAGTPSALRAMGAGAVVVSAGADGLVAVTGEGTWRARPPERVEGNPTGAGDAAVAALATGLADGAAWPDRLRDAVALSAATVLHPAAGAFDAAAYARFRPTVSIEEIACP
jgi:1-phosphofructokinase family hexose kinase